MSSEQQAKWDARYSDRAAPPEPSLVLTELAHLLPPRGRALDLACGLGGNALFLAAQGLQTLAWDISAVAVDKLQRFAGERGLTLEARVRDVSASPPPPDAFDVIVVSHFLDRTLVAPLIAALRSDGVLFYQTFTRERVSAHGPANPDFRLGENELLDLFRALRIVYYREEGRLGDLSAGVRDEALLVAQKRAS
jgi:SAM-dependent methyltransferase